MPDIYLFLGGFMVSLALIGFAFTAGRNYEKRQRRTTMRVSFGSRVGEGLVGVLNGDEDEQIDAIATFLNTPERDDR